MSDRLKKTILLVILFLILIFLTIVGLIYFYPESSVNRPENQNQAPVEPAEPETEQPMEDLGQVTDSLENLGVIDTPEEQSEEIRVRTVARSFTERFGSFSNQSNYANFDELRSWMTPSLRSWTENYQDRLRQEHQDQAYYGIETKVINDSIVSLTDNRAEISLSTQRQESTESGVRGRVFYQEMVLVLEKTDGQWKASGAYWQ